MRLDTPDVAELPVASPVHPTVELGLRFDNSFARLPPVFYTRLPPTPLPEPYLVGFSEPAGSLIGISEAEARSSAFVEALAGNRTIEGSDPLAAVYSGHQFGVYVPRLGDGRALLLGEAIGPTGERWELQLKGSGKTPYSRMGDGRAVLRSSIREFLGSEALHHLGIPTTRAMAVVGSDQPVIRESVETAAVVLRMSPSFLRFGSFEYFYWTKQYDALRQLADYVIDKFYPECRTAEQPYVAWLQQVVGRTARLVAQWQGVGFCHGVLNTDNMSILGLTIDYGPFGFIDSFDAGFICNHSDVNGRYAYNMQPQIAHWNLYALGQALIALTEDIDATKATLDTFLTEYSAAIDAVFRAKLGLATEQPEDQALINGAVELLQSSHTDWTIFWRALAGVRTDGSDRVRDLLIDRETFDRWAGQYRERLRKEGSIDAERTQRMNRVNPKYILRNYLAEIAIRKARGDGEPQGQRDFSEVERLLKVFERPYDEQPKFESYAKEPPDWAKTLELSCSS